METIAVYARQSVKKEDSVSIDTQFEECIARCPSDSDIRRYKDEDFSGKNLDRPDMKRLIDDIEVGIIQKVVVYKLDRISRNITDFYNLYEFMTKHNCAFYSINDGFDTSTAQGRFLMGVLAAFAQMERENTALRVKDSYYHRARLDGRWLGGREPFGFDRCKRDGKSSLKPNKQMQLVIDFYNQYSDDTNVSLHQLVAYAREQYQVKMPPTKVRNILSNPLYVKADKLLYDFYKVQGVQFIDNGKEFDGVFALQLINKTDQSKNKTIMNDTSSWFAYITNWEGVIDSRKFIVIQERLKQNKSYASSNKSTNKMMELSGLIKCAKCYYSVKMKGKYGTLSCVGRSEYRGHCDASFAGIRLQNIQDSVAVEVQKYLDTFSQKQQEEKEKRQKIRNKIKVAERALDRLFEIAEQSDVLQQASTDRIAKKQLELNELQLELKKGVFDSDKIETRVLHSLDMKTDFENIVYKNLQTEKKQALLRIIIEKILLKEDGSIKIVWKK